MDVPMSTEKNKEVLISYYFRGGYSYAEILNFLATYHSINITTRHLHRLLRKYGLYRRHQKSSMNNLIQVISKDLKSSSRCFGYRSMHQNIRRKGYVADRETVRLIIKTLDPGGVEQRRRHRLSRRVYRCRGPNWTWHVDGYDKLKPFGFDIHGCIDGYSRKVLWLKVGPTNNNPKLIGSYFLSTVKILSIIPRLIRSDRGTENIILGGMQRFFRRIHTDLQSGISSFRYGTSTSNQRIESWWSQCRKSRMDWWINYFKDLRDKDVFDVSISYHLQAIRFCFMDILQKELDEYLGLWNSHRIRSTRNSECPGGRPDVLFYLPSTVNGQQGGLTVSTQELSLASNACTPPPTFGCSTEFLQLAAIIMNRNQLDYPSNVAEAEWLLETLIDEIDNA